MRCITYKNNLIKPNYGQFEEEVREMARDANNHPWRGGQGGFIKKIVFTIVGSLMAVAILVAALSQPADAYYAYFPSYDFGSLSWPGGSAGLTGALDVGSMTGFIGSVGSSLAVDSGSPYGHDVGLLTFTTGAYAGAGESWNFLSGGSFSIVGGISAMGLVPTTTLAYGTFGSVSIDVHQLPGGLFSDTVSGSFTGTLDDALAQHYGLSSTSVFGFMSFSFLVDMPLNPTSSFSLSSAPTNPVPVPSAFLFFAPGLAGLAAMRRRFKK